MADKGSGKVAVGVYSVGESLRVAKVLRVGKRLKLLSVNSYKISHAPNSMELPDELPMEMPAGDDSIEITDEEITEDFDKVELDIDEEPEDDTASYIEILNLARDKGAKMALSVGDPQVYYNVFDSDWGLKGGKLLKRVNSEMKDIKDGYQSLKEDSVALLPIASYQLLAVIRERDIPFLTQLGRVRSIISRRLPIIAFTESVEVSLVNHVIDYHDTGEDVVTLILHIGEDYSRFIFMRGKDLLHVSQIIGAGAGSLDFKQILYRRLLLEMDTLELLQLNQIVMSGKVHKSGIVDYFYQEMPYEVAIVYPNFSDIDMSLLDQSQVETLGPYAVAVSIAQRALTPEIKRPHPIDLTPSRIKESQKSLSMSLPSWIILILMPVIVLYTFFRIEQLNTGMNRIRSDTYNRLLQEEEFMALENRIIEAHAQLSEVEKTSLILDSLTIGTNRWSPLMVQLMREIGKIKGIWLTEINQEQGVVVIKGYATYRNRIPQLVKALGSVKLRTVEVQQIRDKATYRFEIETAVSDSADSEGNR